VIIMPTHESAHDVKDPAPHRDAASGAVLAFAILAGPAAWGLQLLVNYGFSSQACYPRQYPRAVPPDNWAWLPYGLMAVTALAFLLAAAAGWVGYSRLRKMQAGSGAGHARLIEVGEGRARFLSACGLWIGTLFAVALAFDGLGLMLEPTCGG
jgi:hypothetical protein